MAGRGGVPHRFEMVNRVQATRALAGDDEQWRHTDAAGHVHEYGSAADRYPTLAYVPGPVVRCGRCGEIHEDFGQGRWECRKCREVIIPAVRHDVLARVVTGRDYYVDGEPATEEQFRVAVARWNAERAASRQAAGPVVRALGVCGRLLQARMIPRRR